MTFASQSVNLIWISFVNFSDPTKAGPGLQMWTHGAPTSVPVQSIEVDTVKSVPWERRFQPYDFNGGYATLIWSSFVKSICLIVIKFSEPLLPSPVKTSPLSPVIPESALDMRFCHETAANCFPWRTRLSWQQLDACLILLPWRKCLMFGWHSTLRASYRSDVLLLTLSFIPQIRSCRKHQDERPCHRTVAEYNIVLSPLLPLLRLLYDCWPRQRRKRLRVRLRCGWFFQTRRLWLHGLWTKLLVAFVGQLSRT